MAPTSRWKVDWYNKVRTHLREQIFSHFFFAPFLHSLYLYHIVLLFFFTIFFYEIPGFVFHIVSRIRSRGNFRHLGVPPRTSILLTKSIFIREYCENIRDFARDAIVKDIKEEEWKENSLSLAHIRPRSWLNKVEKSTNLWEAWCFRGMTSRVSETHTQILKALPLMSSLTHTYTQAWTNKLDFSHTLAHRPGFSFHLQVALFVRKSRQIRERSIYQETKLLIFFISCYHARTTYSEIARGWLRVFFSFFFFEGHLYN